MTPELKKLMIFAFVAVDTLVVAAFVIWFVFFKN